MCTGPMSDRPASLSRLVEIGRVCDDFDAAWSAGERPHLKDYLERCGLEQRSQAFRQLLEIELEYLDRVEEPARAAAYANRFPEFQSEIDTVFARFGEVSTAGGARAAPVVDWASDDHPTESVHGHTRVYVTRAGRRQWVRY